MKIAVVVGVRPHFIKLGALYPALVKCHEVLVVNTGQHFDYLMSEVFLREVGLPMPHHNLSVGAGTHAEQVGYAMVGIEKVCIEQRPQAVIVIGDANPSIAGALAAAKLGIPVCHIEAGVRNFQAAMPEEINRRVIDSIASLHLCSTEKCVENLRNVGASLSAYFVGDLLLDCIESTRDLWSSRSPDSPGLAAKSYVLATIHREENLNDPAKLRNIMNALSESMLPVVFPLHPGTRKKFQELDLKEEMFSNVYFREPASHVEMLSLVNNARLVVSDSNGVQRESFFLGVPCLVIRDSTEFPETIECGCALLIGSGRDAIGGAIRHHWSGCQYRVELFGGGNAASRICEAISGL